MKFMKIVLFFALLVIFTANGAHATLSTWRLVGTVNNYSDPSFAPPAFASLGESIIIDYVIDDDAGSSSYFYWGVNSVTFNGETSLTDGGYVFAYPGLTAMNASLIGSRHNDAVTFISLNSFDETPESNIYLALLDIANNIKYGNSQLRLDFGSNSVFAIPISLSQVPEPSTILLIGFGLLGLLGIRKRTKR